MVRTAQKNIKRKASSEDQAVRFVGSEQKVTKKPRTARGGTGGAEGPLQKPTAPAKKPKNVVKAPIDGDCPLASSSTTQVYQGDDGVIYDASLNQTNIGGNNNKFYYIQLLESFGASQSFSLWTHWGRVGESGQNKLEKDLAFNAALASFEKKFKDKTGLTWDNRHKAPKKSKYTMIEKSYGDEDEEDEDVKVEDTDTNAPPLPECTLSQELQDLVSFCFNAGSMKNAMTSQNYNFNKLPLGKLSKNTIEKGYLALKELGEVIMDPKRAQKKYKEPLAEVFNELTSKYYTVIPHDFGRNRPPPITTAAQLKAETDLVETLGNMQITNKILKDTEYPKDAQGNAIHPLDAQMRSLNLDVVEPLDKSSTEFEQLSKYLNHSREGYTVIDDASIQQIYRISRSVEIDRFIAGGYDAAGMRKHPTARDGRRLLWHGSRGCNFGGILSQGLRIAPPEAPPNGKAFGNGVYLADRSSKSAAYCDPWTSGQVSLLLLCEVQCGKEMYVRTGNEYHAATEMRKRGLIGTKMLEHPNNEPRKWVDAKRVCGDLKGASMPDHAVKLLPTKGNANEYIVYDIAQVKLKYVFMLKWAKASSWCIG